MKELLDKIKKAMSVFEAFNDSGIIGDEDYKHFNIDAITEEILGNVRKLYECIPEKYRDETFMVRFPVYETIFPWMDEYAAQAFYLLLSLEDYCEYLDNEYVMRYMAVICLDLEKFMRIYCKGQCDDVK